jgi:UDP-N-acetyl-alpha-D-muramoyl-L-alanyl-L-glutamate epimerase
MTFVPAAWPVFQYVRRELTRADDTCVEASLHYAIRRSTAVHPGEAVDHVEESDPSDPFGDVIEVVERYRFSLHTQPAETDAAWRNRWDIAHRLLDHLWLVAGLSYYKISAAPLIEVLAGSFSAADVAMHRLLLTRGLGEFCFANGLEPELRPEYRFAVPNGELPQIIGAHLDAGPLVPVGGGKDSCVTMEALRNHGLSPTLVTVRRFPIIQDVIDTSEMPDIAVDRVLDPQITQLNSAGALNGHVPATAIVSFAALIAAVLGGHDALVMSNERSASEGNVEYRGVSINHQWAKSDEAEHAIAATVARITPELRWFSLLRPFSELEISRRFAATCSRYFGSFSSCNRTQRIDPARRVQRWCGECPKCQFVYLALATSLSKAQVIEIWGSELFASSPIEGWRSLLGLAEWKPFECVGEHIECRVALAMLIDRPEWADHPMLAMLADEVRAIDGWPSQADHAATFTPSPAPLLPIDYRWVLN